MQKSECILQEQIVQNQKGVQNPKASTHLTQFSVLKKNYFKK